LPRWSTRANSVSGATASVAPPFPTATSARMKRPFGWRDPIGPFSTTAWSGRSRVRVQTSRRITVPGGRVGAGVDVGGSETVGVTGAPVGASVDAGGGGKVGASVDAGSEGTIGVTGAPVGATVAGDGATGVAAAAMGEGGGTSGDGAADAASPVASSVASGGVGSGRTFVAGKRTFASNPATISSAAPVMAIPIQAYRLGKGSAVRSGRTVDV